MTSDDQISPNAITHCEVCGVRNFALGGRTGDGRFHPAYESGDAAHVKLTPTVGKKGWCGGSAPEHFLSIIRIVCTPVEIRCGVDESVNACQRCKHVIVTQQARESESAAEAAA